MVLNTILGGTLNHHYRDLKKMIEFIEGLKTPTGKHRFQFQYLKARFNDSKTKK